MDSVTRQPLSNATVRLISTPDDVVLPEMTRLDGTFKTGKAIPGVYDVEITRAGYYPKTVSFNFVNGEVLSPEIELVALPTFVLNGKVVDEEGNDIPNAIVRLVSDVGVFQTACDDSGNFAMPAVYIGIYEAQAGVWGNMHESFLLMNESKSVTLVAERGYRDDFDLDLGWTVGGAVTSGAWTRGIPTAQFLGGSIACSSDGDSPDDLGDYAYATGISMNPNAESNDVDGGTTWLVSPPMDFTAYINPNITFDYWICELPPNQFDGVHLWVSNGVDTILIDKLGNPEVEGFWAAAAYNNLVLNEPKDQVRFMISASDTTTGNNTYILKVQLDNFFVNDESLSSEDPGEIAGRARLYPNPTHNGEIRLDFPEIRLGEQIQVSVHTLNGQPVLSKEIIHSGSNLLSLRDLTPGLYFIKWNARTGQHGVLKLVLQ